MFNDERIDTLTQMHLQLHAEHLALKLVTMTMIGMMPIDMRLRIISILEPGVDRNPNSESAALTHALDELFCRHAGVSAVRLFFLIVAAAGIWVGVGYYIWQQQPSVQVCNQFKRELVMIEWSDKTRTALDDAVILLRELELKRLLRERC